MLEIEVKNLKPGMMVFHRENVVVFGIVLGVDIQTRNCNSKFPVIVDMSWMKPNGTMKTMNYRLRSTDRWLLWDDTNRS